MKKESDSLRKLVFSGVFAALTYVVFTFLSIKIPTPGGQVSIHLGNAFAALGALILGPTYGAVAGALGLTIADLIDPAYVTQAPITFVIKFIMGWIVGVIAHKAGHISTAQETGKILKWVIIATTAGMLFNAFGDPSLRYVYKILVLGKPAAEVSFAINFAVTMFNSVVSVFLTTILYSAIRVPLKKAGLFFTIESKAKNNA